MMYALHSLNRSYASPLQPVVPYKVREMNCEHRHLENSMVPMSFMSKFELHKQSVHSLH